MTILVKHIFVHTFEKKLVCVFGQQQALALRSRLTKRFETQLFLCSFVALWVKNTYGSTKIGASLSSFVATSEK